MKKLLTQDKLKKHLFYNKDTGKTIKRSGFGSKENAVICRKELEKRYGFHELHGKAL